MNINSIELDSTSSIKYHYKSYQPEHSLCKLEFDTKYHKNNHLPISLKPDLNIDISHQLIDVLCNENVINLIVNNLIKKNE